MKWILGLAVFWIRLITVMCQWIHQKKFSTNKLILSCVLMRKLDFLEDAKYVVKRLICIVEKQEFLFAVSIVNFRWSFRLNRKIRCKFWPKKSFKMLRYLPNNIFSYMKSLLMRLLKKSLIKSTFLYK